VTVYRYALVSGLGASPENVTRYLSSNYEVIGTYQEEKPWGPEAFVVIRGRDRSGWTLDRYVSPRLGSGMMLCVEVDLSHPALATIAS
jgi:hypothetical protein